MGRVVWRIAFGTSAPLRTKDLSLRDDLVVDSRLGGFNCQHNFKKCVILIEIYTNNNFKNGNTINYDFMILHHFLQP